MTPMLIALLVAWGAGLVLAGMRPNFQVAMIDAELAKLRLIAYDIERLAFDGEIDRESAFYRYFSTTARDVASIKAEHFPSLAGLTLARAMRRTSVTRSETLKDAAWADVAGRYRKHEDIPRRLVLAMAAVFQYRSLAFWIIVRAGVFLVLMIDQIGAMARVFSFFVGLFDRVRSQKQTLAFS